MNLPPLETPLEVIPAATALVFRHGRDGGPPEILMVQRAREMRFAGGAAVFPGGRVDQADRDLAARLAPEGDPVVLAAKIAAMRETLEETGLAVAVQGSVSAADAGAARQFLLEQGALAPVLERHGWTLDLEALVPFAHWCPNHARAFDTRFFLADLGTGEVDVAIDQTENTRLFWASARRALDLAEAGEISVIFPTYLNLERVAQFASFSEVRDHARQTPVDKITPWIEEDEVDKWMTIPDGLGYPLRRRPLSTVYTASA